MPTPLYTRVGTVQVRSAWTATPSRTLQARVSCRNLHRWSRNQARSSVQAASSTKPAESASPASISGVYLWEFSVWIVSPLMNRTVRSAAGTWTVCSRVLTRWDSTLPRSGR